MMIIKKDFYMIINKVEVKKKIKNVNKYMDRNNNLKKYL